MAVPLSVMAVFMCLSSDVIFSMYNSLTWQFNSWIKINKYDCQIITVGCKLANLIEFIQIMLYFVIT